MTDIIANKNMKFAESPNPVNDIVVDTDRPLNADADKKPSDLKVAALDKDAVQKETGGPAGPEPTRYGDWEVNGRCSDF